MSEYYNRLKALNNNYVIGYRGYSNIGQVIIKRVVTFNEYETKFREFFRNNSYRSLSGYSMKFFKDFPCRRTLALNGQNNVGLGNVINIKTSFFYVLNIY